MFVDAECPQNSTYYLSSLVLEILLKYQVIEFENLYKKLEKQLSNPLYIDDIYYSMDWLYSLSLIRMNKGMVELCL